MIHLTIRVLVALSLGILASCSQFQSGHTLMTYNIRHGVGMDRQLDLERTARVIEAAKPDFVVLNEVDHGTARSFGTLQADSLGILLKMQSRFGRSIDYDGGQYGNALLSRYPILDFRVIDLSTDSLLEGRSVFLSNILVGNDTLVIMGTHLGLSDGEREEQVSRILQNLPNSGRVLLAGDFNFEPDSKTYEVLTNRLRDGVVNSGSAASLTFPADSPVKRIDYIFTGAAIIPVKIKPFEHAELQMASDHRPQLLQFK